MGTGQATGYGGKGSDQPVMVQSRCTAPGRQPEEGKQRSGHGGSSPLPRRHGEPGVTLAGGTDGPPAGGREEAFSPRTGLQVQPAWDTLWGLSLWPRSGHLLNGIPQEAEWWAGPPAA